MRPLEGMRVVALEHAVAAPFVQPPSRRSRRRRHQDRAARRRRLRARLRQLRERHLQPFHLAQSRQAQRDAGREKSRRPRCADETDRRRRRAAAEPRPGAAARLGLSHEALTPSNPNLVVCDISGYGESGPMVQKKAYDLLIQAESGLISVTGSPEEPSRVGISIADIATGMYAVTGIMGALLRRARNGQGANVKIAMIDALGEWMSYPMLRHAYAGTPPPRSPTRHSAIAPYGSHRTKDGSIIFGLQNEREWVTFCTNVLRRPEVATSAEFGSQHLRRENRDALTALIEDFFGTMTSAEVAALLEQHGIANGRLNDPLAAWNHEQFAARDKWREIMTENGPVRALLPPFQFTDFEAVVGDVPSIGQHTDQILTELGYAAPEIAALRAAGRDMTAQDAAFVSRDFRAVSRAVHAKDLTDA